VRDNRIGIPPKKKDRLKPTGEGTGLGLSISYEIVTQQHGGTITVDSELGDCAENSTFCLVLMIGCYEKKA
jgi:two-component system, NtrC family, sensor kinase